MIYEASHLFGRTNANTDTFPSMVTTLLLMARDMLDSRLPKGAIVHLPYVWHDVPGTTDMILLNRLYQPIGVTGGWVNYADYPELTVPRHMVHDDMLRNPPRDCYFDVCTGYHPGPDPRRWFYNDSTDPRRGKKYRQRLAGLIQDNLDVLEDLP